MPSATFALYPRARARTAAAFAGAALLLAGCQGGSAPGGSPSATNSTTTSPTSSVSVPAAAPSPSASPAYKPADATGKAQNVPVPVMPELAKENSKAGLEEFIGYWYAQLSYVGETGDMSAWTAMIAQECQLCLSLKESGEDGYVNGRWLSGGRISVPTMDVQWTREAVQSAKVQVVQEQIDYFNADGSVGRPKSEASNDAFAFFAKYVDGAWIVVDLGIVA
ncbi:hypothetical protein SAMN04487912_11323 [Arthrobacter sp. cf158]|uniref:DUF6318 family protein n=1 Tax=Arthrobacter sp. cf158 TaxID=1761744 RepID=UPI00089D0DDC|nr:DUF6318 family protein [Arthrobacter sp. cf158]SDX46314.1 hypothetical protein SAMN04487912_11323 [Arthrobacter sp. cf158]